MINHIEIAAKTAPLCTNIMNTNKLQCNKSYSNVCSVLKFNMLYYVCKYIYIRKVINITCN